MEFDAICQGIGLALAAGLIIGVVVPPVMPGWGAIAGAAPLGVIACGAALNAEGEALWPALPLGLIAAGLAALVARDVAAGAARRERGSAERVGAQASPGVTAIVVLAAAAVAVLSLVLPPVSLLVLVALAWLWLARRRQAERKHEGLRVLR
jgi:hypothetical protein